ncbi:hypothetical protein V5799_021802, partial [Amblyomma americanum]
MFKARTTQLILRSSPVLRSRPFVSSVTEDAATVIFRRWDSKNDIGVGTPREYRIQYRVVPGTTWQSKTVSATSSEMYAVLVNGLMVGAEYEVRILVVTEDGLYTEQDAKATRFQTQCGVPKIPPENVTFDNHSASEIVVKWQLSWSLPQESNGIIRHYRVVYTPIAPSCPRLEQGETQITVPSSTRSTTITGLHPSTRYLVSVAAVTIEAGPAYNMTAQTLPD